MSRISWRTHTPLVIGVKQDGPPVFQAHRRHQYERSVCDTPPLAFPPSVCSYAAASRSNGVDQAAFISPGPACGAAWWGVKRQLRLQNARGRFKRTPQQMLQSLNDRRRLCSVTSVLLTPAYWKIVPTPPIFYESFALFLEIMALIRDFCKLPLSAPGKDYPFYSLITQPESNNYTGGGCY